MRYAVLVAILGLASTTPGVWNATAVASVSASDVPPAIAARESTADAGAALAAEALINEVCWWQSCVLDPPTQAPTSRTAPWIEIFNRSQSTLNVRGWQLIDEHGRTLAKLPPWTLPAGSYLVVAFGSGQNDFDFSDDRGLFFADPPFAEGRAPNGDSSAALLVDSSRQLIDAIVWSELGHTVDGAWIDQAVQQGHWPVDDVFPLADHYTSFLSAVVRRGTSFGRSMASTDTNSPDDWRAGGGADAFGPTPGGRNIDPDLVVEQKRRAVDASAREKLVNPPDPGARVWTVMFYVDGRESMLGDSWKKALKTIAETEYSSRVAFVAQMTDEPTQDDADDETRNNRTRRWAFFDGFVFDRESHEIAIGNGVATNPGDPAALAAFITWAKATYPAQKYAIVMVGHGQGWKGTNITDDAQDLLIMSELEQGLQALGRPFDTLIFESCLMGTVEVAYQLAGEVTNLVVSQEVMWMNIMPWSDLAKFLRNNAGRSGADLAYTTLEGYRKQALDSKIAGKFTISYVAPSKVASVLFPAIETFAQALRNDVEDIDRRDEWKDNLQVTIFERVLRPSLKFFDGSYRDLGQVAERASMERRLSAAAPAAVVKEKMMRRSGVVLRQHRGSFQLKATGLSIYFPHAQTQPDFEREHRPNNCAHLQEHCGMMPVFDHAWHCPHIYARDPDFRLPRLRTDGSHTMVEDGDFHFTDDGSWDEFLHRFYKPVADACIRTAADCVKSVQVDVGTTVILSGHGSSDIDTDAVGDPDQRKHQPLTWHWDFDITRDSPAPLPNYRYDMMYPCAQEDCDRNDADNLDDDPDAHGELVNYTCAAPGTYSIRLMTWDDHNGHVKLFHEDEDHNAGKHWLHFNIDDDTVTVTCVDRPTDPTKRANRAQVRPGEDLEYEILLPPVGVAKGESEPASIVDPLPPEAIFIDGSLQCPGPGVCVYDAENHQVIWEGQIAVEETARLAFVVTIREDVPCVPGDPTQPPPEVVNRAETQRAGAAATATATTPLDCPVAAR